MDESWRIPIGTIIPRRRSTEDQSRRRRRTPGLLEGLNPEDFRDVFGGPPQTVLLRRFSGHCGPSQPETFYNEIFRPGDERSRPAARDAPGQHSRPAVRDVAGRSLPGLNIPRGGRVLKKEEGFYNDIFRSEDCGRGWDGKRSRSDMKAKSKSSSVLSWDDDQSPFPPSMADDAMLTSFTSKLRPITIPSRRRPVSSPQSTVSDGGEPSSYGALAFPCPRFVDLRDSGDINRSCNLPRQQSHSHIGCLESVSLEHSLNRPWAGDNSDTDSPSSLISSIIPHPPATKSRVWKEWERIEREQEMVAESQVDDESRAGDISSSFLIDIIDSRCTTGETEGPAALDDAIAWAKGKFWNGVEMRDETCDPKEAREGRRGKVIDELITEGEREEVSNWHKWSLQGASDEHYREENKSKSATTMQM